MTAELPDFEMQIKRKLARESAPLREALARYVRLAANFQHSARLTSFAPGELVDELALESLRLLELGPVANGARAVDLGSGVGAPVVPLALALPQVAFTAVEVAERRAAFLRHAKALLGLSNLDVLQLTAQQLAKQQPAAFDLLTSRAFAPPQKLLPLALRLLKPGGEMRGYLGGEPEVLQQCAAEQGFSVAKLRSYTFGESPRHVYLLHKS